MPDHEDLTTKSEPGEVRENELEAAEETGELATEETVSVPEAAGRRIEKMRKAARMAGRILGRGSEWLASPITKKIEARWPLSTKSGIKGEAKGPAATEPADEVVIESPGEHSEPTQITETGGEGLPEEPPAPKEEWPRQALIDTEHGKILVSVTGSFGVHKDKAGVEQRHVYVDELKKAVPESELSYVRVDSLPGKEKEETLPKIEPEPGTSSIEEGAGREMEASFARREAAGIEEPKPESAPIPPEILARAAEHRVTEEFLRHAQENPHAADILRRNYGINWGAEHPPGEEEAVRAGREVTLDELREIEELHDVKINPEYLEYARRNPHAADYLRTLGLDIGVPGLEVSDPVLEVSQKGRQKAIDVKEIIRRMEADPAELRRSVRRPGELPARLHLAPIIGRLIGKRVLSWRVVQKERSDRRELPLRHREFAELGVRDEAQQKEFENIQHRINELNNLGHKEGLLGIGLPKYRSYLDYIDRHDEEVRSQRRKLHRFDRHQLRGPDKSSARRDLAELIHRSQEAQKAFDDRKIMPDSTYRHAPFKDKNRAYQESIRSKRR